MSAYDCFDKVLERNASRMYSGSEAYKRGGKQKKKKKDGCFLTQGLAVGNVLMAMKL